MPKFKEEILYFRRSGEKSVYKDPQIEFEYR